MYLFSIHQRDKNAPSVEGGEHGRRGDDNEGEPRTHDSGLATSAIRSDRESIVDSASGTRDQRGGAEAPEPGNPPTSTLTEPAEQTGEEVICGICMGVATEPPPTLLDAIM